MLVRQGRKDVAVEVGVRIANKFAVGLSNLVVSVEVSEMDVTGLVVILVNTVLTEDIKISGLCLSGSCEDTE